MTVRTRRATIAAGVVLILATGLIHLLESGEYLEEAPYVGYLFITNAVGAAVVAIGLLTRLRRLAWIAGILVAGGAFVVFVLSRTVGLPNLADDVGRWDGIGLVSLVVEGLFVVVAAWALSAGRAVAPRARFGGRPVSPPA
jgi:hypothetical protein